MFRIKSLQNFPVIFWLGLTSLSVWIVTSQDVYATPQGDGSELFFYGFPSPWFRWSMASSMLYDVNIPNLLENWAFNGVIFAGLIFCFMSWYTGNIFVKRLKLALNAMGCAMLVGAVFCFLIGEISVNWDRQFPETTWTSKTKNVFWGPSRPYLP